MSLIEADPHPVDLVEQLAALNDWSFDRSCDDEISISIAGKWSEYLVSFSWMEHLQSLHLACSFDVKVMPRHHSPLRELISMINERLWIGHFDLWTAQNTVVYRHALLFPEGLEASGRPCLAALDAALDACERHFQAFQFILWAGKTPQEAMNACLFETMGEA